MSDDNTIEGLVEKVDALTTALNAALQEIHMLKQTQARFGEALKFNVDATDHLISALNPYSGGGA